MKEHLDKMQYIILPSTFAFKYFNKHVTSCDLSEHLHLQGQLTYETEA